GGCGAKFAETAEAIISQPEGRVENDDPYTLVNTLLKMAKKRALVDAVLSATRSSGLFTQDVEDFASPEPTEERPPTPALNKEPKPRAAARSKADGDSGSDALMGQAKEQWPGRDPHSMVCEALNLPEIKPGAIREYWLDGGGTYQQAKACIADVRRRELAGGDLQQAIKEVDAYGHLPKDEQPELPQPAEAASE
ncbi:hypothetical protein LCGC14_2955110, partial [marine sediment metagenome]